MPSKEQDRISAHALLIGLCPLIPLPLVDGIIGDRLKRRLYGELAEARGVTLSPAELKILGDESFSPVGCLWAVLIWPIKKLVKYVLFFLIFKECLDWATDLIHRAQMIGVALDSGALPGRADEVRLAMEKTFRKHTHSPITRVIWKHERPPIPLLEGEYPLVKLSAWLHRNGGGGLMVPYFQQILQEEPPVTAPPESP